MQTSTANPAYPLQQHRHEVYIRSIVAQPYLLLVLTALFWAGNVIAGKIALGHVSPFLLTSCRWLLAILVLLPLAARHIRRDWPLIRHNLVFLFALGTVGFTFFNNILYFALYHTTAINVAIEQASLPLAVFALNFVLFAIRASWPQIVGFVLTMIGVVITVTRGDLAGLAGQSVNIGDALMLVAVICYSLYSVALVRKPPLHWLSFILVLSAAAFLASIPFTLWEGFAGKLNLPDATGISVIVYAALFPSIIAQVCWARGLELIGSNRGGVFINLVPIFTAAIAVVLLGESFLLYHLLAICLVLGGVSLSQNNRKDPQPPVS